MFKKKKVKKVPYEFPRGLEELGYRINEQGELRTLGGEPYVFEVKEKDRPYNEALYDALIGAIGDWVEESLQKDLGMTRTLIPLGVKETDIHSRIYVSPDYMTNDKMMIFIPGTSHTVGIWSRRVLADESIVTGSMIAYTKRAIELGFSVVITNPYEVFWYKDRAVLILPKTTVEFKTIPGSESPEAHTNYVFDNFVIPSAAQKIVIVGNSYGGHCAVDVIQNNFDELKDRVKSVEFTASTHSIDYVKTDKMKVWIHEKCRNWLMSDKDIGQVVRDMRFGCVSVSSGSDLNDFVTTRVIDKIFEYVEQRVVNSEEWEANEANRSYSDDDDYQEQELTEILDDGSFSFIPDGGGDIRDVQDKIKFKEYIETEDVNSAWLSEM